DGSGVGAAPGSKVIVYRSGPSWQVSPGFVAQGTRSGTAKAKWLGDWAKWTRPLGSTEKPLVGTLVMVTVALADAGTAASRQTASARERARMRGPPCHDGVEVHPRTVTPRGSTSRRQHPSATRPRRHRRPRRGRGSRRIRRPRRRARPRRRTPWRARRSRPPSHRAWRP